MAGGVAEVLRNTPKPEIKFAKSGNPARLLTSRKKNGDLAAAQVAGHRVSIGP
jgi:hypothetical protein